MECIGSKPGVVSHQFHYGIAFGGKTEDMAATLVEHGFNYYDKDLFMGGKTGAPLEPYILWDRFIIKKLNGNA